MKVAAALVALAAIVAAAPNQVEERDVSPASVTAALLQVLPSSILAVAITNQAAASSLIVQAFQTGTPAWFTSLPADVQTYLVTADAGLVSSAAATATGSASGSGSKVTNAGVPLTTGVSGNTTASTTGKFSNSTVVSTGTSTSTKSASSSSKASAASSASSSSSSGAAAVPTAVIGGGIAGLVGLLGMLAL